MLMGACLAFQWPISFYSGGLMGLQQQVLLNGINVGMATLRGAGAALLLWLFSANVEVFFIWQISISAAHVAFTVFYLWRNLPPGVRRPRFRPRLFLKIWRFAMGLTGIAITATLLMQLDKVILSRLLSLEDFGYYNVATVIAMIIYRVVGPVYSAVYPQLTRFVELGSLEEAIRLYHKSAQLISVMVFPATLVMALFSKEILLLWTRSPVTADNGHMLLSLLIIGTAIHGVMHVPYALQLAYGWTRFGFFCNLTSAIILVPLIIQFTSRFGAVGAASIWLALNIGVFAIAPQIMHRRLFTDQKWGWYKRDVGRPLLVALGIGSLGRCVIGADWPTPVLIGSLGLLFVVVSVACACVADQLQFVLNCRDFLQTRGWIRQPSDSAC
jgi:O-antigen/teichoic acid export membrane protein